MPGRGWPGHRAKMKPHGGQGSCVLSPGTRPFFIFRNSPVGGREGPGHEKPERVVREPEPVGEVQGQWVHRLDFCLFTVPLFKRQSHGFFTEVFWRHQEGFQEQRGGGVNALG